MLSKRLQALADMVPENLEVIDVGCDHAFLDIYLTKEGKNNCIAVDISENVLNNAKKNIQEYHLEKRIKVVQSNGLQQVNLNPNSVVVVAGMGTTTILEILNDSKVNFLSYLIIQTNNDWEILRRKILKKGFHLEKEQIIYEKNKYYILMSWKKGCAHYTPYQCFLGPILMQQPESLPYFTYLLEKYKKIKQKIPYAHVVKRYKINLRIKWLKKGRKKLLSSIGKK